MNLSTNLEGGCHSSHGRGKIWICNLCTYLLFASVYLGVASADDVASLAYNDGCQNPTEVGELKLPYYHMYCVDGRGKPSRGDCDGHDDQKFKFCEDGTIRSVGSGMCLDRDGSTGLKMNDCTINSDERNKSQQWSIKNLGTTNVQGISQNLYILENEESGLCMILNTRSKSYYLQDCNNLSWSHPGFMTQYYIVHNRGKVLGRGRLRNKKVGKWFVNPRPNELFISKQAKYLPSPVFAFYENGDLVNTETGLCIRKVYGSENRLEARPCNHFYEEFTGYDHGDYTFSFEHEHGGGSCISLYGSPNDPLDDIDYALWLESNKCTYNEFTMWEWVPETWYVPIGEWIIAGDKVTSHLVEYSKTNLESYSEEESNEISSEISAGFEVKGFGAGSTVSTSVYSSVSSAWETETGESITFNYDCVYSNGTYIRPNLLWQWKMTMESVTQPDFPVIWKAKNFYCTSDIHPPICPPYSKCADDKCKYCEAGLEEQGRDFKEAYKGQTKTDEL